jgi:hypothetical protein
MGGNPKDLYFSGPSLKGTQRLRYASNSSDDIHGMLICIALIQALHLDYEDLRIFLEAGSWQ